MFRNLVRYAPDELPSGGETTLATPQETPEPAPEKGSDKQAGESKTVSMTNAALNDRLARAKRSAVNELLKVLGFEDQGGLETALKEFKTLRESKMSEAERLKAAHEEATTALEVERARIATLEEEIESLKRNAVLKDVYVAVRDAARDAGVRYPQDVVDIYVRDSVVETLIGDENKIDAEAVADLIEKVKTERGDWFGRTGPGVPSNRDGTPPSTRTQRVKAFWEEKRRLPSL